MIANYRYDSTYMTILLYSLCAWIPFRLWYLGIALGWYIQWLPPLTVVGGPETGHKAQGACRMGSGAGVRVPDAPCLDCGGL